MRDGLREQPTAGGAQAACARPCWVPLSSDAFPPRLAGLSLKLDGLWIRSRSRPAALPAELWSQPAVALVGARAASAAGLEIAREFGWDLARAGVVVVSGMARGIDAAAHEGALLGGGLTVAVLGCGIERCYPPEHAALAERIAARGALVSEWPGSFKPRPGCFPRRNRLISGLSDVVVLVEGGAESGARHTVRFALDFGREVMAVPRDPLIPGSRAPNQLLREGAAPAVEVEDILALLAGGEGSAGARRTKPGARSGAALAPPRPPAGGAAAAGCGTGPGSAPPAARRQTEGRILRALRRAEALSLGELAERLPEATPGDLQAALVALEVTQRLSRDRSGRFRAAPGAAAE